MRRGICPETALCINEAADERRCRNQPPRDRRCRRDQAGCVGGPEFAERKSEALAENVNAKRQQRAENRGADQNKMAWKGSGPGHGFSGGF